MIIDENEVAIIDMQDLHDILSTGTLNVELPDDEGLILPQSYVLVDTNWPELVQQCGPIMEKLNHVRGIMATLDGDFHDLFDRCSF